MIDANPASMSETLSNRSVLIWQLYSRGCQIVRLLYYEFVAQVGVVKYTGL